MRRACTIALVLGIGLIGWARPLAAQGHGQQPNGQCGDTCGGDVTPPDINLTPTGTVTVQSPLLKVDFCDDVSLSQSSHWIKVNGADQTATFGWTSPAGGGASCDPQTVTARGQTSSIVLPAGLDSVEAYVCDTANNCTQRKWYITYDNRPAPLATVASRTDLLDYGRCAQACFAATYAQSTVPYFTMNTPHSVTLVYNNDVSEVKPFILLDVTHGGDGHNLPNYFYLRVEKTGGSWITFNNSPGESELHFDTTALHTSPTATLRLSGQFDPTGYGMDTTGVYPITILVGASYPGGPRETTVSARLIVVNERSSVLGRGWMVSGLQRLRPTPGDSALITEGDGSATFFQKSGTSTYASPAGDLSALTVSGTAPNRVWTRRYPDSTRVTFNNAGLMTSAVDRFGNTTSVTYDGSNRPWRITDPQGGADTLLYDGNGYLDYVKDYFGRVTQVTVTSGQLRAIVDPDGDSTRFHYTATTLRLDSIIDRHGAATTLGYHSQSGKLLSVTGPAVTIYGQQQAVSPVVTQSSWQMMSTPYSGTLPPSQPFPSVLSASIRGAVADAESHADSFTVNALGQPLRTSGALGDTVTVTYNTQGLATQIVDRLGVTSTSTIDVSGFVTYSSAAGVAMYAHRASGWVMADSTWGNGPTQRFWLNSANGRVDSLRIGRSDTSAALEVRIRYTYDSHGRLLTARDNVQDTVTAPRHLLESHTYNGSWSSLSADSLPSGAVISYAYDLFGRQKSVTQTGLPPDSVSYDAVNRITRSWSGANPTPTRYGYGRQLRPQDSLYVDTIIDPAGNVYLTTRNALGWVVAQTDPAGRVDRAWYDRDGLVRRSINRHGDTVNMDYDALHRITRHSGTANDSARFEYALDGRKVTRISAAAVDTTTLDAALRPTTVRTLLAMPGGSPRSYTVTHTYTAEGWPATTSITGTYSGYGQQFAWRPGVGVLDSLKFGSAWTRFTYRPDLQMSVTRFSASDSISSQQVESHHNGRLRSPGLNEDYAFDVHGRLTSAATPLSSPNRQRAFSYDSLGGLGKTEFRGNPTCGWNPQFGLQCYYGTLDSTHTFRYDAVGNRDTTIGPSSTTTGTYAAGNRITFFDACTYHTDSTGTVRDRLGCADSTRFWWTPGGRLDSLKVGSRRLRFYYDASGRLVRRDSASTGPFKVLNYYLWDGDNLVAELDTTGSARVAEYSYYPGGLDNLHAIMYQNDATPYYAHVDAMGNVRALAISSGLVQRTYNYDEWGRLLSTSTDTRGFNNGDRARWKGAIWMGPDVDLYYMRNRWYEPRTGRFLSEDPIGLAGGINQYAFAEGDPVNARDPEGLGCSVVDSPVWVRSGIIYSDGTIDWGPWYFEFQDGLVCDDILGHYESGPTPISGRSRGNGSPAARSRNRAPQPHSPLPSDAATPLTPAEQVFAQLAQIFSCPNIQGSDFGGVQFSGGVGSRVAATGSGGVLVGAHVFSVFASGGLGLGAGAGSSAQAFYWHGTYDAFTGPSVNFTFTGAGYSGSTFGNDRGGGVAFGPAIGAGGTGTVTTTRPVLTVCW